MSLAGAISGGFNTALQGGNAKDVIAGTIIGASSAFVGGKVLNNTGIPFINTGSIIAASLTASALNYAYTGGQSDFQISFGVASYNFSQKEWGYLGKEGNTLGQNLAFGAGLIGNAADTYDFVEGNYPAAHTPRRLKRRAEKKYEQTINEDYEGGNESITNFNEELKKGILHEGYQIYKQFGEYEILNPPSLESPVSYNFKVSQKYTLRDKATHQVVKSGVSIDVFNLEVQYQFRMEFTNFLHYSLLSVN